MLVVFALPSMSSGPPVAQAPRATLVLSVPGTARSSLPLAGASPLDPISALISWTPISGGCARDIEISDAPAASPLREYRVATLLDPSLSGYVVTHLHPGLRYNWSVVERSCAGSAQSLGNATAVQPASDTLVSSSAGSSSFTVHWTNPSLYGTGLNFSDYRVMESFDNRNFTVAKTVPTVSIRSATVNLSNTSNTIYTFYVAVDEQCCHGMSMTWLTNVSGVEYGSYYGNPGELVNASSYSTDAGLPVYLHCSVVGYGNANYTWQFGDGSSEYGSSVAHQYAATGVYPANCLEQFVISGLHYAERIRFNITVTPGVTPLLSSSDLNAAPGNTLSFVGEGAGGVGPYGAFERSVPSMGLGAGPTLPGFSVTFGPAGTFEVLVGARDAVGGTGIGSANVTVSSLTVFAAPTPTTAPLGGSFRFGATASGGGGVPYTFNWTFGDGSNATGTLVFHNYSTAGSYTTWVVVTDGLGNRAQSASVVVDVSAGLQVDFVLHPTNPRAGPPVELNATLRGGAPPYICQWQFGDGAVSAGCNVTHAWSMAGDYLVNLSVSDSYPNNATVGRLVHIAAPAGSGSPTSTPAPSGFLGPSALLVIGVVAVGAVAVLLAVLWHRRRPPPPSQVR